MHAPSGHKQGQMEHLGLLQLAKRNRGTPKGLKQFSKSPKAPYERLQYSGKTKEVLIPWPRSECAHPSPLPPHLISHSYKCVLCYVGFQCLK